MLKTKYKKLFFRDKYGIVRGCLILGLLVILCTFFITRMVLRYEIDAEEQLASDAVGRVSDRFKQLIYSGFSQMQGIAALVETQQGDEDELLKALRSNGPFTDAGIYRNGELYGVKDSAVKENQVAYIHYDAISPDSKVIALKDGSLQLRVSMDEMGELAAWVDAESVDDVLRSAFEEEYGYAVYNIATGAFLVNHTGFSEGGYYDVLLALNENGSTEELLNNSKAHARIQGENDGGSRYIAQQQTGIQPWGISLIIPENLVQSQDINGRLALVISCAAVMLVVLIAYAIFSLHRIRMVNENARRAIDVGERMLKSAARQARMTLFVYYRGVDGPVLCYDGLNLAGNDENAMCLTTLAAIEKNCGMSEDAKESFEERLHDLAVGSTAEFVIHGDVSDREERVLRVTLSASIDDERSIICSIWDCTQELISQNRAEEERNYRIAVEPKTVAIWQINVSRNRWHALHLKPDVARGALSVVKSVWRDYSADLSGILRNYVHTADYQMYVESMSIDALAELYRSGKTRFTLDYRACIDPHQNSRWNRMTVRLYLNPDSGDVLANLYVFNVDAEKNAELERGDRKRILNQTLTALGGIYYGLYYVDLDKDLCYTAKAQGGELVSQLSVSYKATFDAYIDKYIHPDDRESLRNALNAYTLRKNMQEGSHFMQIEYRHLMGDEYGWTEAIVQPARFENGGIKDVVLALRRINKDRH